MKWKFELNVIKSAKEQSVGLVAIKSAKEQTEEIFIVFITN